jgi:pyridoxal phosphate-dependent aminotransferase EpsN
MEAKKIHLSLPHMSGLERRYVDEALEANWIASGPHLGAFEAAIEQRVGLPALSVSSGTAALHLALLLLGVAAGDTVLCPSLTFIASITPILYAGAQPVFVDSDESSWTMSPEALTEALRTECAHHRRPKAVIVVDLFGQCADYEQIRACCHEYEVPIIEDAAEALGATYRGSPAGTFGDFAVFSFNGNKIITAAGGGVLMSRRTDWLDRARILARQGIDGGWAATVTEPGFTYAMSNVQAAIGLGQMQVLDERIAQRRAIASKYRHGLCEIAGIGFMPDAAYGEPTNWLTCIRIDEENFGLTRDDLLQALNGEGIDARPVWPPSHLQPAFAQARYYGRSVTERISRQAICLPSSSSLSGADQLHVVNMIRRTAGAKPCEALDFNL